MVGKHVGAMEGEHVGVVGAVEGGHVGVVGAVDGEHVGKYVGAVVGK